MVDAIRLDGGGSRKLIKWHACVETCLIRRHISQMLVEDVPDIIDVQPTAALALLQGAQERRIRQQDILDVREYHHDRLGLQKPQHA